MHYAVRRAAAPGIDLALTHGMPAVLETTNPLNVEVYQRAGWTVHAVSDELMPELRVWIMRHDAVGTSSSDSFCRPVGCEEVASNKRYLEDR